MSKQQPSTIRLDPRMLINRKGMHHSVQKCVMNVQRMPSRENNAFCSMNSRNSINRAAALRLRSSDRWIEPTSERVEDLMR